MKISVAVLGWASVMLAGRASLAADWITAPSYYTHDPKTGERVTQYARIGPVYVFTPPDYLESGYRHTRSSIHAGSSADHLHIVEEWGRPVRPYGEWRFPYRPYSVPYGLWAPQLSPYWGQGWGAGWERYPYGPTPYDGGRAGLAPYGSDGEPPWYEGRYENRRGTQPRFPALPYPGGHHPPGPPRGDHPPGPSGGHSFPGGDPPGAGSAAAGPPATDPAACEKQVAQR